jgi:putative phosphoribosyl transferase
MPRTHQVLDESFKSNEQVEIPLEFVQLNGELTQFDTMRALVIFSHGSGGSRRNPRNKMISKQLHSSGFGTLLFDLLTDDESVTRKNIFDIDFLSHRLVAVTKWLRQQPGLEKIPFAYFGTSTGSAAALKAAIQSSEHEGVYAVVSRSGRPDLAGESLNDVTVPTLLLIGSRDQDALEFNREAQKFLTHSKLSLINGAGHLFEEPGALEDVTSEAAGWFVDQLPHHNGQVRNSKALAAVKLLSKVNIT